MKVSAYISWKIKALSLIMIILVLYVHAQLVGVESHTSFWVFQNFVSSYVARVFQPLFFTISGYLFFVGFKPALVSFVNKYKSRFSSLAIPYLFWNIAFFLVIILLKSLPVIGNYVNADYSELYASGVDGWLNALFVAPMAFHLWFIRDLIVIVLLSPLIWWCSKYIPFLFIPLLIIGELIGGISCLSSAVPFSIGAWLAIKNVNIDSLTMKNKWIWICGGVALVVGLAQSVSYSYNSYTYYLTWPLFLFIWFGYDYLYRVKEIHFNIFERLVSYTFFIYVFHEPALNIFKKTILLLDKNAEWTLWACFLLSPLLMIIFSIGVAELLKRSCKRFYILIVGGRQ